MFTTIERLNAAHAPRETIKRVMQIAPSLNPAAPIPVAKILGQCGVEDALRALAASDDKSQAERLGRLWAVGATAKTVHVCEKIQSATPKQAHFVAMQFAKGQTDRPTFEQYSKMMTTLCNDLTRERRRLYILREFGSSGNCCTRSGRGCQRRSSAVG